MSRLTALVPAAVCARAVARDWPDDLDDQVRCVDEGTRALGLAWCCPPWSLDAEDAALLAELGQDPFDSRPLVGAPPLQQASPRGQGPVGATLECLDAVASGLAGTPGAPSTLGLVSGPLWWGTRLASGHGRSPGLPVDPVDPVEAVDAASDLAADRIRALAGCGVERVAVVEAGPDDLHIDASIAAEMHGPPRRAADHLHVDVLLVATGPIAGVSAPAELGYSRWVSPQGCSDGLGFLPAAALRSDRTLSRWVRRTPQAADCGEVVTAPLDSTVGPEQVRSAVAALGGAETGVGL